MTAQVSRWHGQRTQTSGVAMTAAANRAGWWSGAACSTADPELFFPVSTSGPALRQVAAAKAICARCDVQQACLGYALDAGPVEGIWGGTTEEERCRLRPRQRQARASRERAAGPPPVPVPAVNRGEPD